MKPGMTVAISVAGQPGAGKSALIAALGRASQSQERTLGFRIHDPDNQLADARAGVPINLPFEPLIDGLPRVGDGGTLKLVEQSTEDALNDTQVHALVLVCDVGRGHDTKDWLHATLTELRSLRGMRTEVAGFPVIVALNHCDRISATQLTELETALTERVHEFAGDASPAFGDLSVRAIPTACDPAPRGVAEVFAAAMNSARDYRQRQLESRSRLNWTALGATLIVALLAGFVAALVVARSPLFVSALALKVDDYRATEAIGAAARLQEPLQAKADALAGFLADPQFSRLSPAAQAFVRHRLLEIDAYRNFHRRLKVCARPADARNEEQLTEAEHCLRDDAAPPADYADEWKNTDAVVLHKKRLADVAAIRSGVRTAEEWYRRQSAQANQLLDMKRASGAMLGWPDWNSAAKLFLAQSMAPPFRPADRLPETETLPTDKAPSYAVPLSYARVMQARTDFERARARVQSLWAMAEAVGCFPRPDRPAPLDLADDFSVEMAPQVLKNLQTFDPQWAEWSPARFSEAASLALKPQLHRCRQQLIDAGKREIVRRVAPAAKQGVVSPAQWRAVGDAFAGDAALRPWRELLVIVTRWLDPQTADPVETLVEFLRRDQFEIDLRGLLLTIPDAIQNQVWKPAGPFIISIQRANARVETVSFRAKDTAGAPTGYSFAIEGPGAFVIRPGDSIWAEIKVRDANGGERTLTWWANGVRTAAYQFDRFELPPRMHRADQKPEAGELVLGVTVEFSPDRAWPRLPDLLPALR